jgi:hypothetical protein
LNTFVKTVSGYRQEMVYIQAAGFHKNSEQAERFSNYVPRNGKVIITSEYPVLIVRPKHFNDYNYKGLDIVNSNNNEIKIEGVQEQTVQQDIRFSGFKKKLYLRVDFLWLYIESSEGLSGFPCYTDELVSNAVDAEFIIHVRRKDSEEDEKVFTTTYETSKTIYDFEDFKQVSVTIENPICGLSVRSMLSNELDVLTHHYCKSHLPETFDMYFSIGEADQYISFFGHEYTYSYAGEDEIVVDHVFKVIAEENFDATVSVMNRINGGFLTGEIVELREPETDRLITSKTTSEDGSVLFENVEPGSIACLKGTSERIGLYDPEDEFVLYTRKIVPDDETETEEETPEEPAEPTYDDNLIVYHKKPPLLEGFSLNGIGTEFEVNFQFKNGLEFYPYNFIVHAFGNGIHNKSNSHFNLGCGNWEFNIQTRYDGIDFKFSDNKVNIDLTKPLILMPDGEVIIGPVSEDGAGNISSADMFKVNPVIEVLEMASVEFVLDVQFSPNMEGFITVTDNDKVTMRIYTGMYKKKVQLTYQEAANVAGLSVSGLFSASMDDYTDLVKENGVYYHLVPIENIETLNLEELYIETQTCVLDKEYDNDVSERPFLEAYRMARCEIIENDAPSKNIILPAEEILGPMRINVMNFIEQEEKETQSGRTLLRFDKLYPYLKIEIVEEGVYAYSQINETEKHVSASTNGFCVVKDENDEIVASEPLFVEVEVGASGTTKQIRGTIEFSELPEPITETTGDIYGFIRNSNGIGVTGIQIKTEKGAVCETDETGLFYFARQTFPVKIILPENTIEDTYTYYSSHPKPSFKYFYNQEEIEILEKFQPQKGLLLRNYFYEIFSAMIYMKKRGLIGHDFLTLDRLDDKSILYVSELLIALSLNVFKRMIKPTDYRMLYNLYRLTPNMILTALKTLGFEPDAFNSENAFLPKEDFKMMPPENLEGYTVNSYSNYVDGYKQIMNDVVQWFSVEYEGDA